MSALPAAYVLAGGRSRRFGSDKALAEIGGEPLLLRVARLAAPLAAEVTVVADRTDRYPTLGLPTIADEVPERGPLGGLLTALGALGARDWALVLTCDLLVLKPAWVDTLATAARGHHAAAFRGDRWQPFPGLYHRSLLGAARGAVERDELAVSHWLEAVGAVGVPIPADWPELVQANTRQQLEQYRRRGG